MIRETNLVEAVSANGTYAHVCSKNERQEAFLTALGTTDAKIGEVIRAENDRLTGRVRLPRHHKTGPKRGSRVMPAERKKPGFKCGDTNMDGSPRRKPGPKRAPTTCGPPADRRSQSVSPIIWGQEFRTIA